MSRSWVGSGPSTRYCTGQPTGGPSSSGETRPTTCGNCSASSCFEPRLQAFSGLDVVGDDDRLGKERVGQLHVQRQVEADRALTDVGAPAFDLGGELGVFAQDLFELIDQALGGMDRGVLRQAQVDDQFRAIRGREELPRHLCQRQDGGDEDGERQRDGEPARAHRQRQQAAVGGHGPIRFVVRSGLGRTQQHHAEQRREHHGDEPGREQRDADHGEDGEGVFAGGALRKADRHEAGDGDQGADQHREGQVLVGVGGGADLVVAGGQAPAHGVDAGHGVVDHQRQGDDQRAERDPLQVDVDHVHHREDHRQRQRDGDGHHGAGAHAERDEADHQHDADRLPQRGGELVDGQIHRQRLIGDQPRLDAVRQVGLDVGDGLGDVAPERQGVAAVAHGDGEPDGRFAVDAEHRLRRVAEAAAHIGDVAQPQHAIADGEGDVGDVLLVGEGTGDPQCNRFVAGAQFTGRADDVLRAQGGDQGARVEAEAGEPFGGEVDVDDLVLGAEDVDLGDVGDGQELGAGGLDRVAQFAMREAVGGEGVDDAEGVAELVVEEGAADALRQGMAHVADLLAHLVPGIRDGLALGAADQVDEDGACCRRA